MEADHSNPLRNTLVVGQGSSGKTTLAIRYLLNVPWTCAFIFDLQGQFARRLGKRWVGTAKECDEALATGRTTSEGLAPVGENFPLNPARDGFPG